ncbi:Endo-1,4-beta-xylanase A precursor [Enhygromyxa salina]|uniref:Endo-1,4-beta-xylanase A n=1 Tax=Enhygromyxa salina TaxID=215803 RepID=A0A0C1ZZ92_9BACT|nr:Endo-1,4-beta-xylanase A precursor [Enhygromyxa salina]
MPVAAVLLTPSLASAATLQVGPDKTYQTVNAAIAAAQPGDVIEIDEGMYVNDISTINTNDLTIRGMGAGAHLHATQLLPNKKGIFAINVGVGPITVENIEFSGAAISPNDGDNGAGIRAQGTELTVRGCHFHDNQNGILSGGSPNALMTIEHSEFGYNGNPGSGQEHNVYISGDTAMLVFAYNYSHHSFSGHTLKTRAKENHVLYNRIMDEGDGSSSYIIDVPQGGPTYIIGNLLHQGPNAENKGTVISYKREGQTNDDLRLYLAHNTLVNESGNQNTAFVRVGVADMVVMQNNLMIGPGNPIMFDNAPAPVTDEGNLQTDMPMLVDLAGYNYELLEGSPAIDVGVRVLAELLPESHYVHVAGNEDRPVVGAPDIGAYEFGEAPGDGDGDGDPTGDGDGDSGDGDSGDGESGDGDGDPAGDGDGDPTGGDEAGDSESGAGESGTGGEAGVDTTEGCSCSAPDRGADLGFGALALLALLGVRPRRRD